MEISRVLINSEDFKIRNRNNETAFTRLRTLSFSIVMILVIRKSLKSLQLILNEFALDFGINPVSSSAFTQARANLSHTAFIELNQKAVVDVMYRDDDIIRYKGMRVLGIDGSKILLPNSQSIKETFGEISYSNDHPDIKGTHAYGLASVLYDVCNKVVIDSKLGKARDYEVDLAIGHLCHTKENDLLICDRNYPSYFFVATLCHRKRNFVIRCSAASFSQAREMLKGNGPDDQTVTVKVNSGKSKEIKEGNLPQKITVRFVRVKLDTGAYEVLITNLMDKELYPTQEFKTIYAMRWGVEGFYSVLKNRLNVENFTGKTSESVYQDFYAAVYLTGLESILTSDTNDELAQKNAIYQQQVNKSVSFNAIKNQVFYLLYSDFSSDMVIEKLESLFVTNPTLVRKKRKVPRTKRSARHVLNHCKRKQKICF